MDLLKLFQGCAPISPSSGASRRKERPRRNPRSAFQGVEDDHLPSRSIMIYRDWDWDCQFHGFHFKSMLCTFWRLGKTLNVFRTPATHSFNHVCHSGAGLDGNQGWINSTSLFLLVGLVNDELYRFPSYQHICWLMLVISCYIPMVALSWLVNVS